MSFITVEHQNPGAVTKRMARWSQIFGSNLIIETIEKQLDITYAQMYKMTPYRTGYLRSTIKVTSGTDFAQIAVTARYAWYVDQGKSPRGSRPKTLFWSNSVVGLSLETILVVRNLFQGNF
jgi:hypothetical protein